MLQRISFFQAQPLQSLISNFQFLVADSAENKANSYGQYTALLGGSQGVSITDDNVEEMKPTTTVQEVSGEQEGLTNEGESGTITEKCEVLKALEAYGIKYNEVSALSEPLTEQEIVDKLGGKETGDAKGSCSSLALAYIANENGYDVTDTRGGESRNYFRQYGNIRELAKTDGIESAQQYGRPMTLIKNNVVEGETYYFATGRHAAVVRKSGDTYQYLELQSLYSVGNGFKTLTSAVTRTRFDYKAGDYSLLIKGSSLASHSDFAKIMGYINTPTDEQQKRIIKI